MLLRFIKHQKEWNHEFNSLNGMVADHMDGIGTKGVNLAKWQVGYRTGALFRTLRHYSELGPGREVEVYVGSNAPHSLLHHEGTRPHTIRARRAQTLRYVQNGQVRYAKMVRHPGTAPNRYLTDNLEAMIQ